jgi:hypothetical protein
VWGSDLGRQAPLHLRPVHHRSTFFGACGGGGCCGLVGIGGGNGEGVDCTTVVPFFASFFAFFFAPVFSGRVVFWSTG